jgi:hypothetical protein
MAEKDKGFLSDFWKRMGREKEGKEIEEALGKARDILDKAKIAQKNISRGVVTKGILEDTRENMRKVLSRLSDNIDEALLDELLAMAVAGLSAPSTEPLDEDIVEEVPPDGLDPAMIEEMATDEELTEEERLAEEAKKKLEMGKQFNAVRKEIGTVAKAVNEQNEMFAGLIQEMVNMAEVVTALAPLIEKAGAIDALSAQVKSINAKLATAPRRSIGNESSEITNPAVLEILKSQAGAGYEIDPVLRIPLKKGS